VLKVSPGSTDRLLGIAGNATVSPGDDEPPPHPINTPIRNVMSHPLSQILMMLSLTLLGTNAFVAATPLPD
jgi:hypothetical protein